LVVFEQIIVYSLETDDENLNTYVLQFS